MFQCFIKTFYFSRWLLISVTKDCALVELGIVEHCRLLWNKLFLLFVYGPLFEISQEDGDQKSRSLDVLHCDTDSTPKSEEA